MGRVARPLPVAPSSPVATACVLPAPPSPLLLTSLLSDARTEGPLQTRPLQTRDTVALLGADGREGQADE